MATLTEIANQAMDAIGSQPVEDIEAPFNPVERIVASALPRACQRAAAGFDWPHLRTDAALTGTVNSDGNYTFDFPANLDTLWIVTDTNRVATYRYHLLSDRQLVAPVQNIRVVYSQKSTIANVVNAEQHFVDLVAHELAISVVLSVTAQPQLKDALREALPAVQAKARRAASQTQANRDYFDIFSSRYMAARFNDGAT